MTKPLTLHRGIVAPLDRADVDTDALMPKQFMKSIKRTGFGDNLFDAWRYLDQGEPGMDCRKRPLNPDFVLNDPRFKGATVLLVRSNFGCGSSREHAVWGLKDAGFRVLVGEGFADIFKANCIKNGILPVTLPKPSVDQLFAAATGGSGIHLTLDLPNSRLTTDAEDVFEFCIPPGDKTRLIAGLDDVAITLHEANAIREYEVRRSLREPWLFNGVGASGLSRND